jgi:hypothetical protein
VTGRSAILLLVSVPSRPGKRHQRVIETELRPATASETPQEEVFRLKHYRVLRSNASQRRAVFIPSTNMSSLRYIKGRQNED